MNRVQMFLKKVRLAITPGVIWQQVSRMRDGLSVYRRGLKLVAGAAPLAFTAYVAILITLSLVPVGQVWLTKLLIDLLVAPMKSGMGMNISILAMLYLLMLVLPSCLKPLEDGLNATIREQIVFEVDRRMMLAAERLVDLRHIEAPSFHDEVHLLRQCSYQVPAILPVLALGPGTLLTLMGLLLLLVHIHPLLPLALVVVSVPYMRAQVRLERQKYRSLADYTRVAREMAYYTRVPLEATVAHEIRVFGLGDFFLQRFRERRQVTMAETQRQRLRELLQTLAFSAITAIVLIGAFAYIALQTLAGHLPIGDIALYLGAMSQAQRDVLLLGTCLARIVQLQLQLRGLFAFTDGAQPAIALAPEGEGYPVSKTWKTGIELDSVQFHYSGKEQDRHVLQQINARLVAGQVTALVGVNGAGKSTLVKLLTRMYDPTFGSILLDGRILADYDLAAFRGRIAVVYQDFAKFALTLRENITLGDVSSDPNTERIVQAAEWSGADTVAARLPSGYDTQLTKRFEDGVELSGGEWQKVALARSFLRDAALIILDEPTSALDAEAEHRLFQHFRQLIAGKTALLISHRLSTARMADQILVLDGGRIIEAGSHDELLARGGHYASLYTMQAERYR